METFAAIKTMAGHKDTIFTLAFSPDGSKLVTGSKDTTAIVWNMETFTPIKTLEGHENAILSLAFNHEGSMLATGSFNGTVIVWNMETLDLIKTFLGHEAAVYTLAFNPDDTTLATGSGDKTAILWNTHYLNLPVPKLLTETGALSNLRVCQDDSLKVVPITPFPKPETVWVHQALPPAEARAACAH